MVTVPKIIKHVRCDILNKRILYVVLSFVQTSISVMNQILHVIIFMKQ